MRGLLLGEEEQDFLQKREVHRLGNNEVLETLPCRFPCRHGKLLDGGGEREAGSRYGSLAWVS